MRVALDARMIDHSGIGAAIEGWLEGFEALERTDRPALTLLGDPARLGDWSRRLNASVVPFRASIYSLGEQIAFPPHRGRWDLLHAPHYAYPVFYRGPIVVTIHDLFHLKYGGPLKAAYQSFFLGRLRARRCPILTVSEHSRGELVERAGFAPPRVTAIPHGVSDSLKPLAQPAAAEPFRRARGLPERYLLWIGIAQLRKNLERLLRVLAALYSQGRLGAPFVLAGLGERDRRRMGDQIAKLGLGGRVHAAGRFERRDLAALFAGAIGLVFPSLEEGFGLPPLEAMALDTPAAVSNRPPMNEICGEAALRFDPTDEVAMAEAICRLESDEALRRDLVERGRARVRQFRWPRAARQLVEAYGRALEELGREKAR